jgi:hypothetical protein
MQYIKNVTNKVELGKTAYEDCEGVFKLAFNHNPTPPSLGDTIVLCQKIDGKKYFTHLVVVLDNEVYPHKNATNEYDRYLYVQIISKGRYSIKNAPEWSKIDSRAYMRGGHLTNIGNLSQVQKNTALSQKLREEVWGLFFPSTEKNFIEVFNVHRHGFINRP